MYVRTPCNTLRELHEIEIEPAEGVKERDQEVVGRFEGFVINTVAQ
jgi:hypothetical protein